MNRDAVALNQMLARIDELAAESADDVGDIAEILSSIVSHGPDDLEKFRLMCELLIARERARVEGRVAAMRGLPREACAENEDTTYSQLLANAWRVGYEDYRREKQDRMGCLASRDGHTCTAQPDLLATLERIDSDHPGAYSAALTAAERGVERCARSDALGILEEALDESQVLQMTYEKKANLEVTAVSVQPKQHALAL